MNNDNEKLNKFIQAVQDEIDSKIKKIIDDAEAERDFVLEQAENEAEEAAEKYYNINFQKNDKCFVREISSAELNMKKRVIHRREELVDKVFEVVKARLIEFKSTPKYVDMLVKHLLLMHITDDMEIYMSAEDMKYAELLKKAIPSHNVKIYASDKIVLGGMSVYNISKGTIIDKTFDLAIEEKRRAFANSNAFFRNNPVEED